MECSARLWMRLSAGRRYSGVLAGFVGDHWWDVDAAKERT
jgi:hypothetical protein